MAETLQQQHEEAPTLEELYEKAAWKFEDPANTKKVYEVFKSAVDDDTVFDDCGLDDKTKSLLLSIIKRRLTPQAFKIRADVEVTCFAYEGIDAVKAALRAGIAVGTAELPVNIQLIAPPLYVITTHTTERPDGLALLNEAIEAIKKNIEASDGNFSVKMAPKVVSDVEDEALREELEKLELQNQEVRGFVAFKCHFPDFLNCVKMLRTTINFFYIFLRLLEMMTARKKALRMGIITKRTNNQKMSRNKYGLPIEIIVFSQQIVSNKMYNFFCIQYFLLIFFTRKKFSIVKDRFSQPSSAKVNIKQ